MSDTAATREERFASGMAVLDAMHDASGHGVIESLADIAPELGHQIVAWGYGDILSRPGLDPQQRELVTLGLLTAMGGTEAQLEVHIAASLNVGLTPEQIIEVFLQSSVYCGFPRALNAVGAARRVFAEHGLLPLPEA